VPEEEISEASLSAEQPQARQAARVPPPDGDSSRPRGAPGSPVEGPRQAVGLIWRIGDRATFADLAANGRRVRRGAVWLTFVASADAGPSRVAYAVGRSVGSAVVRNRLRRRLRAIIGELAQAQSPAVRPGAYLIGAGPAAASYSYEQLKASVASALSAIDSGPSGKEPDGR
jgi:ribonuclease P protein component